MSCVIIFLACCERALFPLNLRFVRFCSFWLFFFREGVGRECCERGGVAATVRCARVVFVLPSAVCVYFYVVCGCFVP